MELRRSALSLLLLTMNAFAADTEKLLFDFSSATNAAHWQIVNDDVMGGVSTSRFEIINGVAVFHGTVSLENNGGFASVRSLPVTHDLTGCQAFVVRVRSDGRRYKFTARTDRSYDSAVYQATFATQRDEWQEHCLQVKEFVPSFRGRVLSSLPPLNPAQIVSVGFLIAEKQAGPFRLEIAWIKVVQSPRP